MTPLRAPTVSVRNLSIELGRRTVLQDLSAQVAAGEFACILGPNGCGKTTLLNAIVGFVPVARGSVTVNETAPQAGDSSVGYVPQDLLLFDWMTVEENVAFGLRARSSSGQDVGGTVERWLRRAGLTEHGQRYPFELSGGMKQKLALVRALAIEPRVLCLDEPFSGLDAQTWERMQEEVAALVEDRAVTVVMVTHSVDEAVYLSDRVFVLGGRPAKVKLEEVIEAPRPRPWSFRLEPAFAEHRAQIVRALRASERES